MPRALYRTFGVASILSLSFAGSLSAQQPRKSPHETAKVTLAGKDITISYGRPSLRGRKVIGAELVPYGQVWRTGADEATKLTTPVDLMIGDLKVPAGSYALFTVPGANGWTLIVNKTAEQWGAFSYDKGQDLGRTAMKTSKPPAPVEQFTISFAEVTRDTAIMRLTWENSAASVELKAQ